METKKSYQPEIKTIVKAFAFCVLFTAVFILLSFFKSFFHQNAERITHAAVGTVAAFAVTWLFLKIDKRSFANIGLKADRKTCLNFFKGVFIGILMMGTLVAGVIFFSGFQVEVNSNTLVFYFLYCTLPLIPLAFLEELAFRGYPLVILKERTGIRSSIFITSLLFAAYHLANGRTLQNAFLGAGIWGIIYGLAAFYGNGISMPTGLHYAVNLTTSAFGISAGSCNLFILKQHDGSSLENHQTLRHEVLIPQLIVLFVGIIYMEMHIKKRKNEEIKKIDLRP